MEKFGKYEIVLEKGEAKKSFSELTSEERKSVSDKVLHEVFRIAREYNLTPIIKKAN